MPLLLAGPRKKNGGGSDGTRGGRGREVWRGRLRAPKFFANPLFFFFFYFFFFFLFFLSSVADYLENLQTRTTSFGPQHVFFSECFTPRRPRGLEGRQFANLNTSSTPLCSDFSKMPAPGKFSKGNVDERCGWRSRFSSLNFTAVGKPHNRHGIISSATSLAGD